MTGPATTPGDAGGTSLAALAFATGLLPIVVVHACYALSVAGGHVPACVPYLAGCTSISAAGREGVAYFLFKGGMIPAAVLLAAYWVLARRWLLALGSTDAAALGAMATIGVVAAAFLVLYAVFLGSAGEPYRLMRRYGATVHFAGSALAQLLLTRSLLRLSGTALAGMPRAVPRVKLAMAVALLALGLANIPIGWFMPEKDRVENAIEWTFAAVLAGYYLASGFAWRATGFRTRFAVAPRG
jgi:hypothetical protein